MGIVAFDGLTEGRMVHFVTERGEHRPAVVVRVWDKATGYVNIMVFADGSNDGEWGKPNVVWETSVQYAEPPADNDTPVAVRTWHWIERA